jgi:hypothetical protein
MDELYPLLVFFHVLFAFVGVGSSFAYLATDFQAPRTVKEALVRLERDKKIEVLPRYFSLLAVLSGALLLVYRPELAVQLWVLASFVSYLLIVGIGLFLMGPQARNLYLGLRDMDENLLLPFKQNSGWSRYRSYSLMMHGLAVVIILMMVLKPA